MIRLEPIEELRKAAIVARTYALHEVSLAQLSAKRTAPYGRDPTLRMQLSTSAEASHKIAADESGVSVFVEFAVSASIAASSEPQVMVTGTFALEYARASKEANLDPSNVDAFAKINGPYNAWPYIREVVAAAFGRMGYPRLTLEPLIVNPKPSEEPPAAKKRSPPKRRQA